MTIQQKFILVSLSFIFLLFSCKEDPMDDIIDMPETEVMDLFELVSSGNFGGTEQDIAYDIISIENGNYLAVGKSKSTNIDITNNHGQEDFWVFKIDEQGNLIQEKSFGGTGRDQPYAAINTSDGGYMVVGLSTSEDGDLTENKGGFDYWLLKLNQDLTIDWQKTYGGSGDEVAYTVDQLQDNSYIVSGFSSSLDGDISDAKGGNDAWIIRVGENGDLIWEKSIGGSGDEQSGGAIVTATQLIFSGRTKSSDGVVSINKGMDDAWVFSLDYNGNLFWQNTLGGSKNERFDDIISYGNSGYVLVGNTLSNDGDISVLNGGSDALVALIGVDGQFIWNYSYGGSETESCSTVLIDTQNEIRVIGSSSSSDRPLSNNYGGTDAWIFSLNGDGDYLGGSSFGSNSFDDASGAIWTDNDELMVIGYSNGSSNDLINNKGDYDMIFLRVR